jgi:hypothetical protein
MPYLKACILESLRLSYGLSARNPRTRRTMPLHYKDLIIPANTNVVSILPQQPRIIQANPSVHVHC